MSDEKQSDPILSQIDARIRQAVIADRRTFKERILTTIRSQAHHSWSDSAKLATDMIERAVAKAFDGECPTCGNTKV